jgi:hypothetical protein
MSKRHWGSRHAESLTVVDEDLTELLDLLVSRTLGHVDVVDVELHVLEEGGVRTVHLREASASARLVVALGSERGFGEEPEMWDHSRWRCIAT